MTDINSTLDDLRRPRLLVQAARFGLPDYVRDRTLRRVLGPGTAPAPGRAVDRLMEREAEIEAIRQAGNAGYSAARHVEVLTALIAECRFAAEGVN